ncbi:UNVERIFIED_CONTAM: hypothetical protein H355_014243, partial [Colinus virginianus]
TGAAAGAVPRVVPVPAAVGEAAHRFGAAPAPRQAEPAHPQHLRAAAGAVPRVVPVPAAVGEAAHRFGAAPAPRQAEPAHPQHL